MGRNRNARCDSAYNAAKPAAAVRRSQQLQSMDGKTLRLVGFN